MNKQRNEPLMVTIRCLAYNEEKYIRQCLDGFVMQKTNFKFEAIVHDDASTDGTARIILEYASKYPDIIKPIIEKDNLYSKHDGSLAQVINNASKGKYIAFCEGDDYWTDPLKLQKQVDFLESHPDCSLCFHNAIMHWEDGREPDALFSNVQNRYYSGIEIFREWTIPTASVVIRYSDEYIKWRNLSSRNNKFCYGDILCFLSASKCGKLYGLSGVMSVYRRQPGGLVFSYSIEKEIKHAYHCLEIYRVFGDEFKEVSLKKFGETGVEAFWNLRGEKKIIDKELLNDLLKYSPALFIKSCFRAIMNKIYGRKSNR